MGSPEYMAPEQAEDAHRADIRADIYGMGCTLYQLLSGQVPFPESSLLRKLEAHRDKQAILLDKIRPGVSPDLAAVVAKMMAKDPSDRFQTPVEVSLALSPFTAAEIDSVQPELIRTRSRPYKSIGRRKTKWVIAIVTTLSFICLAYIATQIVFRIETPHGTLIVTTDDPDVQISVKQNGQQVVLFFPKTKQEIPLKVGPYTVDLVDGKDGMKLTANQFEITNDKDQIIVSVVFEPVVAIDVERQAAEYVLSIGGTVHVNNLDREITAGPDLPNEAFWLTHFDLTNNQNVTDEDLSLFADCKHLVKIGLGNANVGDSGVSHFKDCKKLKILALNGTQVTDAGMANFADSKNLYGLWLDNTKVGDAGLAHFKNSMKLEILVLNKTVVTDVGLANFVECKNLYWLHLRDTNVGDAGLAHFQDNKAMVYLDLSNTYASDIGLTYFQDCHQLKDLWLSGTQVTDEGLSLFRDCKHLVQVQVANTQVSDAGLLPFKDCQTLSDIYLTNSKVSAAGIAELKQALPNCKIE